MDGGRLGEIQEDERTAVTPSLVDDLLGVVGVGDDDFGVFGEVGVEDGAGTEDGGEALVMTHDNLGRVREGKTHPPGIE